MADNKLPAQMLPVMEGTEPAGHTTQLSCMPMFSCKARLWEICVADDPMLDAEIEVLEIVQDCSSYRLNAYDTPSRISTYRAQLCTMWWPETRALMSSSIEECPTFETYTPHRQATLSVSNTKKVCCPFVPNFAHFTWTRSAA